MTSLFTQMKNVLTGHPDRFYDLFERLAGHAVSCAGRMQALAREVPEDSPECQRIREEEAEADAITHQVSELLSGSFIPPIDPTDVHDIAEAIDDVIDQMDEASKRVCQFHVRTTRPEFVEQMDVLAESTRALAQAVGVLRRSRWAQDLRPALDRIHRLERQGDQIYQSALSNLFEGTTDPLTAIQWNELLTLGERAVDCCMTAANVLERVALHGQG